MEGKSRPELGISLTPGQLDSANIQQIGLQWINFPWRRTLLRGEDVPAHFKVGLSPLPPPEVQGDFPHLCYGNLANLPEVNLTVWWDFFFDWVPLEFLTLKSCPHWTSSNPETMLGVFLPGAGSCSGFYAWLLLQVRPDSLCPHVSPVLGTAVCMMPSPLLNPGRTVSVSLCSAFHFLRLSGDIRAPYLGTKACQFAGVSCSHKGRSHRFVQVFFFSILNSALSCIPVYQKLSQSCVSSYFISRTYCLLYVVLEVPKMNKNP